VTPGLCGTGFLPGVWGGPAIFWAGRTVGLGTGWGARACFLAIRDHVWQITLPRVPSDVGFAPMRRAPKGARRRQGPAASGTREVGSVSRQAVPNKNLHRPGSGALCHGGPGRGGGRGPGPSHGGAVSSGGVQPEHRSRQPTHMKQGWWPTTSSRLHITTRNRVW